MSGKTLKFPIATKESMSIKVNRSKRNEYTIETIYSMEDSPSLLESIRSYQLSMILGKYKIF